MVSLPLTISYEFKLFSIIIYSLILPPLILKISEILQLSLKRRRPIIFEFLRYLHLELDIIYVFNNDMD